LHPDGLNLLYFKFKIFDLTEFMILKSKVYKNKSARAKQLEGVEAPNPPSPPARLSRVKSTVVNRALLYLHEGSLGIMLTVPLI